MATASRALRAGYPGATARWRRRAPAARGLALLTGKRECSGHGTCLSAVGSGAEATCLCDEGYGGAGCEGTPCARNCSGHGVCSGDRCWCEPGWGGPECAWRRCPFDCGGHGSCGGDGVCTCDDGWAGFDCTTPAQLPRVDVPTPESKLANGYGGLSCATHCLDACEAWCVGGEACKASCLDACVPACLKKGDRTPAGEDEAMDGVAEAAEAEDAEDKTDQERTLLGGEWTRKRAEVERALLGEEHA